LVSNVEAEEGKIRRIQSADLFRGIAVVVMIWAHTLWYFSYEFRIYFIPTSIIILIFTDTIAIIGSPFFFLGIGIAITFSVEKRRRKGQDEKGIFFHQFSRGLFLIGVGYLFTYTLKPWLYLLYWNDPIYLWARLFNGLFYWSIFHSIGLFIIFCYAISYLSRRNKIIVLIGLLAGTYFISHGLPFLATLLFHVPYQSLNMFFNFWLIQNHVDLSALFLQGNWFLIVGGFLATIAYLGHIPIFPWLSFCVIGLILGEVILNAHKSGDLKKLKKSINGMGLIFIGLGTCVLLITWIWSPFFLDPVFYTLISVGFNLFIFYFCVWVEDIQKTSARFFRWIKNTAPLSLTLVLLHNNVALNIFMFINDVLRVPLHQQFPFPLFLIPTATVTCLFILLAQFWKKYENRYSLEWIQSKL